MLQHRAIRSVGAVARKRPLAESDDPDGRGPGCHRHPEAVLGPKLSTTQPETKAPSAMPMPMPVITQVTPSVSIASGTRRSIRPKAVMKVGEIAMPLTKTATASSGTELPATSSGNVVSAMTPTAISSCRCSGHAQVQRAEDQADDEGTDGIDADHQAGGVRLAKLLGDRDGAHFGRREDRADEDQRERDDLHRPLPDRRARRATPATWRTLRLGRALQDEGGRAERQEQRAHQHAGFREQRHAQPDRQRGAGDVDQLVGGTIRRRRRC